MDSSQVLQLIILSWFFFQNSNAAISSFINEFAPKYHYADTARTFEGQIVRTPHHHLLITFQPIINEGEVIKEVQLNLKWQPKHKKENSKTSFQMIAHEIKNRGKLKGYPLDSKRIPYSQNGSYIFDVSEVHYSNKTTFLVQLTPIQVKIPFKSRQGKSIDFRFIPKGCISEATLVFYTTDEKGKIKQENLNHEVYEYRKKREARASDNWKK